MKKSTNGFTIVELLVVIAVIGILTTITLIGFTRYQMSNRDTERETKTAILAEALEKYYDNNGEYPGCLAVNNTDTAVISMDVLLGVESKTYLTPKSATGNTNSIECINITGAAGEADVYAYVGDGSATCNTGAACLGWTLKYREESTNSIKSISSRRSTNIATSGTGAIVASPVGFTQINTSWGAVNNALSYEVQRATNIGFTTGVVTQSATLSRTLSVPGLTYDTQYYFRVRAVAAVSVGEWSSTVGARTWGLTTPTTNALAASSTSFNVAWSSAPHADSYTIQLSSDGTTWSTGWQTTQTGTSWLAASATQGWKYYVRAQALAEGYASAWSNVASAITPIDNPAAFPLNSSNTLPNWNYLNVASGVSCPAGTSTYSHWYANGAYWTDGGPVSYGLSWNTSVIINVASRCYSANYTSGWVWASNDARMDLPIPSVWSGLLAASTASWGGWCPKWSTSSGYYWRVHGDWAAAQGVGDQSGGLTNATSWDGRAYNWGNGTIRAALLCNGPWGTYRVDSGPASFGPKCSPTATIAACSW